MFAIQVQNLRKEFSHRGIRPRRRTLTTALDDVTLEGRVASASRCSVGTAPASRRSSGSCRP